MKPLILVVEDEPALGTLLTYNLEREGFEVALAHGGEEALLLLAEREPALVLLDWMLPDVSGIEICRQIRRKTETALLPVIMVTARGEEADKVRGLDIGADDYLTKPFSLPELLARIRALLRRGNGPMMKGMLIYADIQMDLSAHRVTRGGKMIHLGPTEYKLLQFFLQNPGQVFSREQLLDAIWGPNIFVEARTVDVHIRRLRKALNGETGQDVIRTVRAAGYALELTEEIFEERSNPPPSGFKS